MTIEIDVIAAPDVWDSCLARLSGPKAYASYQLVKASELLETGAQAEAAVVRLGTDILFHPYLKRPIPGRSDTFDLTSPYEFGGFWFSNDDVAVRQRLLEGFTDQFPALARQMGVVCEFARMHPWLAQQPPEQSHGGVMPHGQHCFVDLRLGYQEIFSLYSRSTKKQVRQGYENRLYDRETVDFSSFCSIYHQSLRRLGANPYYYFPIEFFDQISDLLHCFLIYTSDGEPCGAHAYLIDSPVIYAFLCHSVPRFNSLRVNNYGYDRMIRRAVDMGFETLHLGGGHPSLFHFKTGFATGVMPHSHLRTVYHPALYAELAAGAAGEAVQTIAEGYFPAYRRPSPEEEVGLSRECR